MVLTEFLNFYLVMLLVWSLMVLSPSIGIVMVTLWLLQVPSAVHSLV